MNNITKLHKKLAKGGIYPDRFFDLIWTHSDIVRQISLKIAHQINKSGVQVNGELVEAGAMLHDIGVYICFDNELNPDEKLPKYISHGHEGYKLLKNEGFGEDVSRFALTHTGTGITKEDVEREKMPFDAMDYIPVTLEEEIVCYGDKFHTKWPSFNTFDSAKEELKKFDPSKGLIMDRFRKKFGEPDLSDLMAKYDKWHKEMENFFNNLPKAN